MIIDAHLHVWELSRGYYDWITPDLVPLRCDRVLPEAEALLAVSHVDAAILVQAAPVMAETRYLVGLAQKSETVCGVVGWLDLEAREPLAEIDALGVSGKLVGVRPMLQDMPDASRILGQRYQPLFAGLADRGLVFDALVRATQLDVVTKLAVAFPTLTIVVDHAAKPSITSGELASWEAEMAVLASLPNVRVKLSGLVTEAPPGTGLVSCIPVLDRLLDMFGPGRSLWGSDWPVLLLNGDYASWLAAVRTVAAARGPAAAAAIMGGTASQTYRLGGMK